MTFGPDRGQQFLYGPKRRRRVAVDSAAQVLAVVRCISGRVAELSLVVAKAAQIKELFTLHEQEPEFFVASMLKNTRSHTCVDDKEKFHGSLVRW